MSVNWHKGTMWPYESMAGIGAKFCFLNRVSPPVFQQYIATFCQEPSNADLFSVIDQVETNIAKFAVDLGEPRDKIRELRVVRFFPPRMYFSAHENRPSSASDLSLRDWYRSISYCPVCIGHGFHASFHQMAFFLHVFFMVRSSRNL